jgi:hypothetical protein
MPAEKVEIGFDLVLATGPYFTLDDATKGKLDNTSYTLAGFQYYDITSYVTGIQLTRGKSDDIATVSAGDFVVELNNRSRAFDPTYASSPFYGQIIPKRQVRYSVNGIQQAQMVIDDWNLAYQPNGDAVASFVASDGFVYLNNQTLSASTATSQLSGARVNAILDDPYVSWPASDRVVDTGTATFGADIIPNNQNVLQYLQQIEQSEQGLLFIGKTGNLIYQDKTHSPTTTGLVKLADDGTGIPYQNMQISYGSENLINEVTANSVITNTEITTTDTDSQATYGIFNATFSNLLVNTDAQVLTYEASILKKYAQPVYRFTEVQVRLNGLSDANANAILGLELGDFINVVFTPSNLPPAINKYAQVIRFNHSVDITGEHIVTLGLNTLNFTYLILDDTIFGKLDEGSLS